MAKKVKVPKIPKDKAGDMVFLVCSFCEEAQWKTKMSFLTRASDPKGLDILTIKSLKIVEGKAENRNKDSIPLDCSWCGADVFEVNYGGGYRVWLRTPDSDVTERFPDGRNVPGLRLGRRHYADPRGMLRETREKMAGFFTRHSAEGTE